jgi:predicted RNA-binding protein with PIN domain
VLLVVDGYNASLSAWADLPIVEQRDRLVSALEELAARTGARAHVVFDGVDAGAGREQRVRGRCVVTFSPDEVEADDVIIEMVDSTPASTAVVVATDDRRVRDAAAAAGANLLTRDQLFGVLRRER